MFIGEIYKTGLFMISKEFLSVAYTAIQMSFATAVISANHKSDYRVIGNTDFSITFLCRTGYHWSTISEIRWHELAEEKLDYTISCMLNPEAMITKQLLKEYADKHIAQLVVLIDTYVGQTHLLKGSAASKRRRGFI
ncbi:hypothetical protein CAP35_11605 [Chitinophagaceae bacterium IBVUCB1]|nr:hypothetical protein CAP35_11605 [Chitinophagaceae bacterium IBVUCB1]